MAASPDPGHRERRSLGWARTTGVERAVYRGLAALTSGGSALAKNGRSPWQAHLRAV